MAHRLESDLSREVIEYLNGLPDCFAYVTHGGPYQRSGIPDIVGIYKSLGFGIELKMEGKYPSPIQRKVLRDMRAAGGMAITAWSLETVVDMIAIMGEMIAEGKS